MVAPAREGMRARTHAQVSYGGRAYVRACACRKGTTRAAAVGVDAMARVACECNGGVRMGAAHRWPWPFRQSCQSTRGPRPRPAAREGLLCPCGRGGLRPPPARARHCLVNWRVRACACVRVCAGVCLVRTSMAALSGLLTSSCMTQLIKTLRGASLLPLAAAPRTSASPARNAAGGVSATRARTSDARTARHSTWHGAGLEDEARTRLHHLDRRAPWRSRRACMCVRVSRALGGRAGGRAGRHNLPVHGAPRHLCPRRQDTGHVELLQLHH